MNGSRITIFYSWQSDLPGSDTRNIIQDSIKDAVHLLRDTVDIEADRDTKGEFGSPDIVQTIFSKIDDCDIFIADVSAVCQYETFDKDGNKKIKYMPNPNVMLELGYATHVIGWDRVICVLNSDYGAPENMPFDIASRRLTPFSLKDGKSKGEVKRYIKGVIQDTVENILANGKRVKAGFSDLRLGCFVDGVVSNLFQPIEVSSSVSFVKHKTQILDESLKLVEQIRSNKIIEPSELQSKEETNDENNKKTSDATPIIRSDGSILTPVASPFKLNPFKLQKVYINDEDRDSIINLCKEYLTIDISEDTEFFNIGNLERKLDFMSSYSYEGTKEEEDKYDSIVMLEYNLHHVQMMDLYVTTFNGMLFIPLAIENVSKVYDEDVNVQIKIKKDVAEAIAPSKKLINPNLQGLEGLIYEDDIIKELLKMPDSADISYDADMSYTLADSLAESQAVVRAQFCGARINGNSRYNSDDYGKEITKYIAMPRVKSNDIEFEFSIRSLRAKEIKWLGPALLLNPLTDSFNIEYFIKSKHSDGDLSGIVTYAK